jgi:hypothetical protein
MFCLVISLPTAETWSAEVVRPVRERMERKAPQPNENGALQRAPLSLSGETKDL